MNLPTLGAAVVTSEPTDASVGSGRAPVEKSDRSLTPHINETQFLLACMPKNLFSVLALRFGGNTGKRTGFFLFFKTS